MSLAIHADAYGPSSPPTNSRIVLQGFIGALGTGPTTFFLPSIFWLILKKPGYGDWNFYASWICIFLGGSVTVLGSIGGMRDIIVSASGFSFYN